MWIGGLIKLSPPPQAQALQRRSGFESACNSLPECISERVRSSAELSFGSVAFTGILERTYLLYSTLFCIT